MLERVEDSHGKSSKPNKEEIGKEYSQKLSRQFHLAGGEAGNNEFRDERGGQNAKESYSSQDNQEQVKDSHG